MSKGWYEVVEFNARLTQGDLIFDCPIMTWKSDPEQIIIKKPRSETLKSAGNIVSIDAIVMTQACDLEQNKVKNAILCPHYPIENIKNLWEQTMHQKGQNPKLSSWDAYFKKLCEGAFTNLCVIKSDDNESVPISHKVVDFSEVHTLPRDFLEFILEEKQQPRLRLLSPYREYLSQVFAKFFMRIGLPISL